MPSPELFEAHRIARHADDHSATCRRRPGLRNPPLGGQGFAAVRAVGWRGGQSYVGWVLVGDDRALGDGRASVGKDCVVVRASGGGVVVRVLAGVSEWLRACWLARQLPVVKSKTHSPPGKQARLASHRSASRLTATSQPARGRPLASSGVWNKTGQKNGAVPRRAHFYD